MEEAGAEEDVVRATESQQHNKEGKRERGRQMKMDKRSAVQH